MQITLSEVQIKQFMGHVNDMRHPVATCGSWQTFVFIDLGIIWNLIPNHLRFGSLGFNSFWEDRVELPFTSIHMEQYAFEVSWLRLTLLDFEELLENSVWSTVMRIITNGRVKILGNSAGRDRADRKHPISQILPVSSVWLKQDILASRAFGWLRTCKVEHMLRYLWAESEPRYNNNLQQVIRFLNLHQEWRETVATGVTLVYSTSPQRSASFSIFAFVIVTPTSLAPGCSCLDQFFSWSSHDLRPSCGFLCGYKVIIWSWISLGRRWGMTCWDLFFIHGATNHVVKPIVVSQSQWPTIWGRSSIIIPTVDPNVVACPEETSIKGRFYHCFR